MKKKLLTLSLAVLTVFGLNAQVNIVSGIPANNGSTTQLRAPNGSTSHTSFRAHMIIPAAEITTLSNGDAISSIGFSLAIGVDGVADGNIQFYLENTSDATNLKSTTWATAITPMTSVYNGTMTLPNTNTPANIDLTTTGAFTYTGGGLYVAYEYSGSNFVPLNSIAGYLCNNTIADALKMDSTSSTTQPATLTLSSAFRPEIRFGVANPNANDMTVNAVRPVYGKVNRTFTSTTGALAFVTNTSNTTLTNVDVTLDVTGANIFNDTQTIPTINAGETQAVPFTGVPTANSGTNTYTITVPNDDDNGNNSATADQEVGCDAMTNAPIAAVTGGLGFNQGTGIMANRIDIPTSTSLPVTIKKVVPTISNDAATPGNTIKGVLLNAAGTIVDSTNSYTINAGNAGNQVELSFINGNVNYSGQTVYVGIRQTANTTGYFPLATAAEFNTLPSSFYTFGPGGGASTEQTGFGAFLIDADLAFGVNIAKAGTTLSTTTTGAGMTYQWINCGTGADIAGETGMSYTATSAIVTGSYAVTATFEGCEATSPCEVVSFVGLDKEENAQLSIYPNPVVNVLNIDSELTGVTSYSVYDMEGRVVLRSTVTNGSGLSMIDASDLESGTYLLELNSDKESARKVFVKH